MAKTIQICSGGVVVNAVRVPNDATIASGGSTVTWSDGGLPLEDGVIYRAQDGAQIGWLVDEDELIAPPVPYPLRQALRVREVDALRDALLAGGAPAGGLRVKVIDADSRADMGAMATTALGAAAGTIPWPASYALGWITMSNTRLPLPAPADGLAFAASVGAWYAGIVQHARTLKDALLAAEDVAALDTIDIDAGWPE